MKVYLKLNFGLIKHFPAVVGLRTRTTGYLLSQHAVISAQNTPDCITLLQLHRSAARLEIVCEKFLNERPGTKNNNNKTEH